MAILITLSWLIFAKSICYALATPTAAVGDYFNYPVLPAHNPPFDAKPFTMNYSAPLKLNETTKHIPRILWISFKERPVSLDDVGEELGTMITQARNEGWTVYCLGHHEQVLFMELYFPNTSLLWAVQNIHPNAGASVSDIWRVAAVYAFGGLYMDDDSVVFHYLEDIVQPTDKLIIARERVPFNDHCYHKQFHLSGVAMKKKHHLDDLSHLYGNRRFLQWMFLAAPRHAVLRRILENMVEVIRLEYLGGFAMYRLPTEPTWKYIVCATGPDLWTSTIRELTLNKEIVEADWRVLGMHDFVEYHAHFKLRASKHYKKRSESHYIKKMLEERTNLLLNYAPFNLSMYEHWPVSDGGRAFYYIDQGKRRGFPNYDTYTMMGFTKEDTFVLSHADFINIPMGTELPAISDRV